MAGDDDALDEVRRLARPLRTEADLDPLVEALAAKQHVRLGEVSHGTAEFYRWRAAISKRLIEETTASTSWRSRATGRTASQSTDG